MEEKLRIAQMLDGLHSLKHTLRVKARMIQFKKKNIHGQRDGVRSQTVIDRVHLRAYKSAVEYQIGQVALLNLRGPGEWEKQLRELADGDIRSYVDPARVVQGPGRRGTIEEDSEALLPHQSDSIYININDNDNDNDSNDSNDNEGEIDAGNCPEKAGTGETWKEISWIWRTTTLNINDVLRSEWCKSRARARRAEEQVRKTKEEMRRTLVFLRWRGDRWRKCTDNRSSQQTERRLQEGLDTYALKQASLQEELRAGFEAMWKTPMDQWAVVLSRDKYGGYDDSGELERAAWEEVQGGEGEDSDTEVTI